MKRKLKWHWLLCDNAKHHVTLVLTTNVWSQLSIAPLVFVGCSSINTLVFWEIGKSHALRGTLIGVCHKEDVFYFIPKWKPIFLWGGAGWFVDDPAVACLHSTGSWNILSQVEVWLHTGWVSPGKTCLCLFCNWPYLSLLLLKFTGLEKRACWWWRCTKFSMLTVVLGLQSTHGQMLMS